MHIKRGTFRIVLLTKKYAIKIPLLETDSFKGRLYGFIHGWQQNLCELAYYKNDTSGMLCPIKFSFFGLINIMPRCDTFIASKRNFHYIYNAFKLQCDNWFLVENKVSSFGILNNQFVAIDYGNDCISLQQDKLRHELKYSK